MAKDSKPCEESAMDIVIEDGLLSLAEMLRDAAHSMNQTAARLEEQVGRMRIKRESGN